MTSSRFFLAAFLATALLAPLRARAAEIPVVTAPEATSGERIAAEELAATLQKIFPRDRFVPAGELPATGKAILVGTAASPIVARRLDGAGPTATESYLVRSFREGGREIGLIAGADPRGTAYGVYAVLAKLGCAFTLTGDALPPPRDTAFGFEGWQAEARPLTGERLVFNWHNFLSGCSTWNLPDWQRWTTQSQKMGFNAIMVHAYGNNPMAGFEFQGRAKPVGYLSTTIKGRDWNTMHVNDVRRLHGGEVFDRAAFGAEAGLAPDSGRVAAAQALMREVFAHAGRRGMKVYFAVDVDTPSANPAELVKLLPESARFDVPPVVSTNSGLSPDRVWLPNPDTPEGYGYYREQVATLLRNYPQVTHLVAWFRRDATPMMAMKAEHMPKAWQEEFAAEAVRTPGADQLWHAPGLFAVGKILRAFERALREVGASHTQLAAGTWDFEFLPAGDRFFPAGLPVIGLDYAVVHETPQLDTPKLRAPLAEVGAHRPLIPIVWAHHDDGHYIGRPYTPLEGFATKLAAAKASGFGVIHWTTRPLDLYFSSVAQQAWSDTKDRPLAETCRDLAGAWFGADNREKMGEYLQAWIAGAPRFGRETSDLFIDRKLGAIDEVNRGGRARLALLDQTRTAELLPEAKVRLDYFRGLEEFILAFHEAHGAFQRSRERLGKGDLAGARAQMAACRPEAVIALYARLSSLGGISRGEQGVVVTLNTRWLSHIVQCRQTLGLEAVRIRFGPTSHDPLAQSRGTFTYHFDSQRRLWQSHGEQETGAEAFVLPAGTAIGGDDRPSVDLEIGQAGIQTAKPLTLALRPIVANSNRKEAAPRLPAGEYRLRLLLLEPEATAPGQRVFDVELRQGPAAGFRRLERIDCFAIAGGANRLVERVYPLRFETGEADALFLRLTPVAGKALLCGLIVEPVN